MKRPEQCQSCKSPANWLKWISPAGIWRCVRCGMQQGEKAK